MMLFYINLTLSLELEGDKQILQVYLRRFEECIYYQNWYLPKKKERIKKNY